MVPCRNCKYSWDLEERRGRWGRGKRGTKEEANFYGGSCPSRHHTAGTKYCGLSPNIFYRLEAYDTHVAVACLT